MKRWHWSWIMVGLGLAVLFVPVLVRQLVPVESRQLERVALSDTRHVEITFQNRTQNLELAGLLFVPEGDGPFPAAVVIHGSGTSRRDNGWYLTLTQHLQDSGIAVLLPDKRGSEKSEGNWRTSSFEDLATDTRAAIEYLRQQKSVPISGIGVIGMSQGGWIAPLVASQEVDLAFLVSLVGSAVTPREQLLYEENYNLRQAGFLPGISNVLAYAGSANVRYLAQPELYELIVDYDPLPFWRSLSIDSLALFGADDTNVPSAESARRLVALNNPRIQVKIYEGSGHALESPVGQGKRIIRKDALEEISVFILESDIK
ncbi:MAG: alpha/beta fold hydrolase [Gammaproteobacteria bacterium]|nr:alpha/beta fold hydrolase [Gammaproteobacteria bacterium]